MAYGDLNIFSWRTDDNIPISSLGHGKGQIIDRTTKASKSSFVMKVGNRIFFSLRLNIGNREKIFGCPGYREKRKICVGNRKTRTPLVPPDSMKIAFISEPISKPKNEFHDYFDPFLDAITTAFLH